MNVDYHMHTLCSDGRNTVEQVVEQVKEEQLESFSIADHDTIDGVERARELCPEPVHFVSGVEITCREVYCKEIDRFVSIHLLGYGFDEHNRGLFELFQERRRHVAVVFLALMKELATAGYPVELSNVPISCGNYLQLRDILSYVSEKYNPLPENVKEIIDAYYPAMNEANISLSKAIYTVKKAGGFTIWAHPFHVYHHFKKLELSREEVTALLLFLKQWGLDGIESDYLGFQPEERDFLRELAKEHGMICSAGSDYHGTSSPRNHMGVKTELKLRPFFEKED